MKKNNLEKELIFRKLIMQFYEWKIVWCWKEKKIN